MAKNKNRNPNNQNPSSNGVNTNNGSTPEVSKQAPQQNSNIQKKDEVQNKKVVEKVNSQMAKEEDSTMAKVIGFALIILGVVFIILVLLAAFLSRREPQVDSDLNVPTLEAKREFTNAEELELTGETSDESNVMFYVNDEEHDERFKSNNSGEFEVKIPVKEEGEYVIEAATVKGFPLAKRSEKSESIVIVVDYTAPSSDVQFEYDPESKDGKFKINGKIDPDTKITLDDGDSVYSVFSDDKGEFELDGIELDKESKETKFKVSLEDRAGNIRELQQRITVKNLMNSENNGENGNGNGGESPTDLPEASGELSDALNEILGNNLMIIFGLAALGVFAVNSGVVLLKAKKE